MKYFILTGWFLLSAIGFVSGLNQKISLPDGVIEKKLKNGFTYYHVTNGDRGKVRLTMLCKAGALAEKPHQHGYAHILEHLMADGTKNFPGKQSVLEMDKMGMRRGKEMSAFTSMNYTQYNLIIPPDQNDYFQRCLILFRDWAAYLEVDSTMLENEKKVILEELRMGGKGKATAFFYDGTVLEGHDLLGNKDDIQLATVESLTEFYKKAYRPDLLAVIVYGQINEKFVENKMNEIFGSLPVSSDNSTEIYPDLTRGNSIAYGKPIGLTNDTELKLVAKFSNQPKQTEQDFRNAFISQIFSRIFENRINKRNNRVIQSGKVMISGSLPTTEFVTFQLKANSHSLYKNQLDELCYVLAQIKQHGISNDEIKFFANQQMEFLQRFKNSKKIDIDDFQYYFLNGDVPVSGANRYAKCELLINTLSSTDFENYLQQFLKADKLIHLDSTSTAFTPDFNLNYALGKFASVDTMKTDKYIFKIPSFALNKGENANLNFQAVSFREASLKKSVQVEEGIQLLKLGNGLTIILRKNNDDKVVFKMIGNGGIDLIPSNDRMKFDKLNKYLVAGYGQFSSKEIFQFERLNNINFLNEIKDYSFTNTLKGNVSSFENLCQVYHSALVSPTKLSKSEVEKIILRINNSQSKDTKSTLENDSMNLLQIKDTNELFKLFDYKNQILRNFPSSFLYVCGNLPDNANELILKYFSSIPASKVQRNNFIPQPAKKGVIQTESFWKRESSLVSFTFENKKIHPKIKDEFILDAIAELVNIKMLDSLREKYGLVYSTGFTTHVLKYPSDQYSLNIRYMIDANNIEKSKVLMIKTLTDLKDGKVPEEELIRLKALLVSKFLTAFYDEEQLSDNWMLLNLKHNQVFSWNQLNKIIASIKTADIKQAMSELFDMQNFKLHYYLSNKD